MRGLLENASRGCVVLGLLAALAPAEDARAFTPTQDDRYVAVTGAAGSPQTPVPFQPFSGSLYILLSGGLLAAAGQQSSFLPDGVTGLGSAGADAIAFGITAESVLDIRFDIVEGSVFALDGTLGASTSSTFLLERTAPSPAVLASLNGSSVSVVLDERFGMLPGSYRLRAAAVAMAGTSSSFDVDFQLACSSVVPQDSDGDQFVDPCDICPVDFDPGQTDIDGDGIGDACNDAVDADGDDYADALDNCPSVANADQIDADYDGDGDACDVPEEITLILDPDAFVISNPTRAALAPDGTAYVVAFSNSKLFQIPPPAGPALEFFVGATYAANVADVAIAPDGFVYTAGGPAAKCYRIHPGTRAATQVLGPSGDGVNALTWANRVAAAPDGRVFVSGRDSQNVFEIAVGGALTQVIGPSGNGSTALGEPRALEVDAAGNLYVLSRSGSNSRLFRVTPAHQVQLVMTTGFGGFPSGFGAADLAFGPDDSLYVAGDGVLVRRPSGTVEVLLPVSDARSAVALDVDVRGVVHVVQSQVPTQGFRIPPEGPIAPLIDATGDGLGHPLQSASDVVVADGPDKRIVVVGTLSRNAFLIADPSAAVVPLLGPAGWTVLVAALLGTAALTRRRR